ncbi:uncharacterized protein JCM6883_005374 [Sporobolomyces salmoneus]|uniref:uncharacterized protein n=1 Tax=Sporobolomyces salmoneus TaxID=183962 RepID=UPI003173B28A
MYQSEAKAQHANRRFTNNSPAFTEPIIPASGLVWSFFQRLAGGVAFLVGAVLGLVVLHSIDTVIFLLNLVTPAKKQGYVVPPSFSPTYPPSLVCHPILWSLCAVARFLGQKRSPDWLWQWTNWKGIGHQGDWGIIRLDDDVSRSPCPALNALANADILPRDGRNITQAQLSAAISRAYNLSPTLAIQLGLPFAVLFEGRGKIDLEDISAQGLVQHDGSIVREDINSPFASATVSATQGSPSLRQIDLYFPHSVDPDAEYTWRNQVAILAHARRMSRSVNGQFVLSPLQFIFSSGNVALQTTVIGGKVSDLRAWLGGSDYNRGVEGFEKGFEPKARMGWGISILQAQLFTALVELTCGPLNGPRVLAHANDVEARNGWNAMKGKVGDLKGE